MRDREVGVDIWTGDKGIDKRVGGRWREFGRERYIFFTL